MARVRLDVDEWDWMDEENRADGDGNACIANSDRDAAVAVAGHRKVDREAVAIIVLKECRLKCMIGLGQWQWDCDGY